MAHPKRRQSKTRTRKRRTHDKAVAPTLAVCPNCGAFHIYHTVCPTCGYYRGYRERSCCLIISEGDIAREHYCSPATFFRKQNKEWKK